MWDFSEDDIERFMTNPRRGRKTATIEIEDTTYVLLWRQARLKDPKVVTPNPQPLLFAELGRLREFLPRVEGNEALPDIIGYREPKSRKELVVFELKNRKASVRDLAQLRAYLNIVRFHLDANVQDFKGRLKLQGKWEVRGLLLARSIPQEVWLSASYPYSASLPDIELASYELESSRKKKEIRNIEYCNMTRIHRGAFQKTAGEYRRADRKRRADRSSI